MLISFAHTQRGPQNPKFYLCLLLVGLPPSTVHLRLPLNFHLWAKEKKKRKTALFGNIVQFRHFCL